MSESNFLDGKITRKYLAESASIELATKKKPKRKSDKKRACDTSITKTNMQTFGERCCMAEKKRKSPVKK